MQFNRITTVGSQTVRTPVRPTSRQTARLAIEEVLGPPRAAPVRQKFDLPRSVPAVPGPGGQAEASRPRTRRHTGRGVIVTALVAMALCLGAALGSGLLNPGDQFNAERLAVQEGGVELYQVPEVHGHPGSGPAQARSGSIREFLGMASAF